LKGGLPTVVTVSGAFLVASAQVVSNVADGLHEQGGTQALDLSGQSVWAGFHHRPCLNAHDLGSSVCDVIRWWRITSWVSEGRLTDDVAIGLLATTFPDEMVRGCHRGDGQA